MRSLLTYSRSVALSVFMNSCFARSRMSGSNLRAERQSSHWGHQTASNSHIAFIFPNLLDILTDLSLKALTPLLQLFDGAVLGKLVGGAPHLTLCEAAGEQLLQAHKQCVCVPASLK